MLKVKDENINDLKYFNFLINFQTNLFYPINFNFLLHLYIFDCIF